MEGVCAYKNCKKTFLKNRKDKQYCSLRCKCRASDLRNGRSKRRLKRIRKGRSPRLWRYRRHKKDYCENCGFLPIHSCQLDVDHVDGNRKNNDPSNLRTLCANCHRLKTFMNKDYMKKSCT